MQSAKIIFLDIDGVLNTSISTLDREKVALLKEILQETKADVVLTSSWRFWGEKVKELNNAGLNFISTTSLERDNQKPRGKTIKEWIENNNYIGKYAMIDDDYDFSEEQKTHLFKCQSEIGLTEEIKNKVIEYLKK